MIRLFLLLYDFMLARSLLKDLSWVLRQRYLLVSIGIIMIFRSLLLLTMSLTPVAELQGRLPARRVGPV